MEKIRNYTRAGWRKSKTTLETSGEDQKLHSKWVEKIRNYTRAGCRKSKTTLETSGEDQKLHSKWVEKIPLNRIIIVSRSSWFSNQTVVSFVSQTICASSPLVLSEEDASSPPVLSGEDASSPLVLSEELENRSRILTDGQDFLQSGQRKSFNSHLKTTLVWSVFHDLPHSFRVCFWSSPLV